MHKKNEVPAHAFFGVALAIILFGAAVMAFGVVGWLGNTYEWWDKTVAFPSLKIIGGACIIALGYIHLELELIRSK